MVPQPVSVPPPLLLHHSHQVGVRIKRKQVTGFIEFDFIEIYLCQHGRSYPHKAKEEGANNSDES